MTVHDELALSQFIHIEKHQVMGFPADPIPQRAQQGYSRAMGGDDQHFHA